MRNLDTLENFRSLPLLYEKSFLHTMKTYDLTQFEVDVLGFLHIYPECDTAKQICELRKLPKATVSVAVDKLTKKGYLCTTRDVADRRIIHLEVTDSARDAIESIMSDYEKFIETLFYGFTQEEMDTWAILQEKITANIANALRKKD